MMHFAENLPPFDRKLTNSARIAIVRTDYHKGLVDSLENACRVTLKKWRVPENHISTFAAPGSWEIPLLVRKVLDTKNYDVVIALGVIVKGETYHFETITNECARGLMRLALDYGVPVINEVLAVSAITQAEARAGNDSKNKGIEAAIAALKILAAVRGMRQP